MSTFVATSEDLKAPLHALMLEIAEVEKVLADHVCSQVDLVSSVGLHTLKAGGKRLRPALVAVSAKATGLQYDERRAREMGACMEMIHMATLIHDDVVDKAATRRGVTTAAATYGNTASILSGDVLLAKAMAILARDGDLRIIRRVSEAVVDLAEGEVQELETRGNFELTEAEHLEILRRKTATFIQCCCEVGGLVADALDETVAALGAYGYSIGMAFQVVDDLLDYKGEQHRTGKPFATDFREGCATLPLIYLRTLLEDGELEKVKTWFGNGATDDDIRVAVQWMEDRGSFKQAFDVANVQVKHAIEALRELPQTADRNLLEAVAEFVLNRKA